MCCLSTGSLLSSHTSAPRWFSYDGVCEAAEVSSRARSRGRDPSATSILYRESQDCLVPQRYLLRTPDWTGSPSMPGSISMPSRARRPTLSMLSRLASATITKSSEMERALPHSVRWRNYVLPNGVAQASFRPLHPAPLYDASCRAGTGFRSSLTFAGDRGYIRTTGVRLLLR